MIATTPAASGSLSLSVAAGGVPPQPGADAAPETVRMDGSADPRGKVLVAEDAAEVREALCGLLEDLGFSVVGDAPNGKEAVVLVDELLPEAVLMDMRMPVLDGIEATRLIKAKHPLIQVVILSAYEDPGLMEGAKEAGVCCYLVKGSRPHVIRDVLQAAIDLHRGLVLRSPAVAGSVEVRDIAPWRTEPARPERGDMKA